MIISALSAFHRPFNNLSDDADGSSSAFDKPSCHRAFLKNQMHRTTFERLSVSCF